MPNDLGPEFQLVPIKEIGRQANDQSHECRVIFAGCEILPPRDGRLWESGAMLTV
jgi:hypothetical protein